MDTKDILSRLEGFGQILAFGFGNRTLLGALTTLFDDVTPYQCYEYIRDNKGLFDFVSDDAWQEYRELASSANLEIIEEEKLNAVLRKFRPDLLQIIINDPKGQEWIQQQIADLNRKLGLA